MRSVLITPPASEPITLDEAKLHARIDEGDDDTLVTSLITSARKWCENYCQRAFIYQTWRVYLDSNEFYNCNFIRLPKGDLQSVSQIQMTDMYNNITTLTSDNYYLTGNRIIPNADYQFPDFREYEAFAITYVSGFGATADSVPSEIKLAIKMLVAQFYENRESLVDPVASPSGQLMPVTFGFLDLLQPFRIYYV